MGEGSRIERRKNLGKAATQRKRDREQDAVKHADGKWAIQRAHKQDREEE